MAPWQEESRTAPRFDSSDYRPQRIFEFPRRQGERQLDNREVAFKTLCVGEHVQLRSDKQVRGLQRPQVPLMMLDRQANVYKKLSFDIFKD